VTRSGLAPVVLAAVALLVSAPAAQAKCPDEVDAPSALVLEVSTGDVACAIKPHQRRSIASTVKLMTALITLENAELDETFVASDYRPAPVESQIGLRPGERMTVRDLLRGLLLASGNDAAMTLAEGVAGSERAFVRMMNRRAQELELRNTQYRNPIGLDEEGAYSSARDLARLTVVLRTNPFFRRTVNQSTETLETGVMKRDVRNRNELVHDVSWVNGVKTGSTNQAGEVLVGSARQNGIQVVSTVLGAPSKSERDADSVALLEYGIGQFQRITAAPMGTGVGVSIPIRYRRGAELELVIGRNGQRTVVPRGEREKVMSYRALEYPAEVEGPIAYGSQFGTAEVLQDGERIAVVPLVAATEVPAAGLAQRTKAWFTTPIGVILGFAVLTGTVLLLRRVRRPNGPSRRRVREEAPVG